MTQVRAERRAAQVAVNIGVWLAILGTMVAAAALASWLIIGIGAQVVERAAVSRPDDSRTRPAASEEAPPADSELGVAVVPDLTIQTPSKLGAPVYGNPAWVTRPAPEYPFRAIDADVGAGTVVLTCEILAEGRLGACEATEETPRGYGFADAALTSARDARLRPPTLDGRPVDGRLRFTVRFRLE